MKINTKILVGALLLVIIGFSLLLILPPTLYVPPSLESISIKRQIESNLIVISANITNKATFSVYIIEGKLTIYNDAGEIGVIEIGEVEIPSNQPREIDLIMYLKEGDPLNSFLSELLNKGFASFYYSGELKIRMPLFTFLTVNLNVPKTKSELSLGNYSQFISISKISLTGDDVARIFLDVRNPTNLALTLVYLRGDVLYEDLKVGFINYTGLIELPQKGLSRFFVDAKLEGEGLSKAINDMIRNKYVNLNWKGDVKILLGDLGIDLKMNTANRIDFDFNLRADVKNVVFISPNELEVNLDALFSISEIFELDFRIIELVFEAFAGNEKIGTGSIANVDIKKGDVNNVTLTIKLEDAALASLLGIFFSGKSVDLDLMHFKGIIQIQNREVQISSERRVSVTVSYEALNIGFVINVLGIMPTPDLKRLNITLQLVTKAPNIRLLNLKLVNPSFLIYEEQTNTSLIISTKDITLTDKSNSTISILLDINDPRTNKVFSLFAVQGKVNFLIKNLNASLKVGDKLLPISLSLSQSIEVSPLGLVGVKVYAGLITSRSLGSFEVTFNVTISLKSEFPIQLYIYQVTYDVYSDDGKVLIAKNATLQPPEYEDKIPIVILVGKGSSNFIANVYVAVTPEGLKWIAENILVSDFLNFTVKDIKVYLKLFNLPLTLYIPSYKIQAELYPRVTVTISQFTFHPGGRAEVTAQIYSPNYRLPLSVLSLNFSLNDGKSLTRFAFGSLIKLNSNINGSLINGDFSVNFIGVNPLTYLGPLIKGEETLLYASNVDLEVLYGEERLKVFFEIFFIRVKSLIEIETAATLKSFTLSPSSRGIDIIGEGLLNVTLKQGINAPIKFSSAKFGVLAPISGEWRVIGSGELLTQGSFTGNFASLNLTARVSLSREGFSYFGQNLLSKGFLLIKLSNITMHVSVYELEGDLPFVDIDLPIQGPYIPITLSNVVVKDIDWGLSGTNVAVRKVLLSVDVIIRNPYSFPVTLSNIVFDVYHSSGAFLGRGTIPQTVIIPANDQVLIRGITVEVTNISPIYQNLQIRILSVFPLRVQACVSGVVVYAEGKSTATIYDISFPLIFKTPKQGVPTTCAILS